ncbi:mechanosensitive ion channel family protein [Desulfotruncus alcoholivorax]|uniref:mechanosensitive ion channel family protein n=1 Tax=Desulfotruncus alcoholivorax TaxID=265477 RepID=UPI000420FF1D|nr:mechanosensitive ion channel family protein [Desulfotruncus alcoholivorax]
MTVDQVRNWIMNPANIQSLLINIGLSAVVLFTTYLLIKILSLILDRVMKERGSNEENKDNETDNRLVSDNIIRSTRVLLKTLLLYGGYFFAAILILQIFNVKVISADDLKSIGVKIIKIVGVLVGAKLAISIGQLTVKQIFERHKLNEQRRTQTLEALLRSVLTYIIFFLAALMILEILNVNTSAILASAGILGLAVGFGAQNLVKDVISGFFILFENQFNVGDFIETAGVIGTVEEIGLRTCKIRQWTGQLHIIPNGEITKVTNYNRGQMMAVVTVGIAYEEDIDRAIEVLKQESHIAYRDIETILDEPQVQGVIELADSSVNIRTIAPTIPGEQWSVERELRRRFKYALDRAGIEIPYPRRVLYQREEENHSTGDRQ